MRRRSWIVRQVVDILSLLSVSLMLSSLRLLSNTRAARSYIPNRTGVDFRVAHKYLFRGWSRPLTQMRLCCGTQRVRVHQSFQSPQCTNNIPVATGIPLCFILLPLTPPGAHAHAPSPRIHSATTKQSWFQFGVYAPRLFMHAGGSVHGTSLRLEPGHPLILFVGVVGSRRNILGVYCCCLEASEMAMTWRRRRR